MGTAHIRMEDMAVAEVGGAEKQNRENRENNFVAAHLGAGCL